MELHRELMAAAIERDAAAQRSLLSGDVEAARAAFEAAAGYYRDSWEAAPPKSYGRLVGMLKSALLARGGREQAQYVRATLHDEGEGSATAAYAQAIAALILDDDQTARRWAVQMRGGSEAFARTARAIEALAAGDRATYAAALQAIVRDFEQRSEHLTGVAIADTAAMLQLLATRRSISADVHSPLLPA